MKEKHPLLRTKLQPPRLRAGYLARPRLWAQLDRGLDAGLILVSAPAGYGKSTLVANWLNQLSRVRGQQPTVCAAWLSLDEADNEWDVFLRYVAATVQMAFPEERPCTNIQSLLEAPQPLPLEVIANTLINDLAALSRPLLLILDDYHLITAPVMQEIMTRLVHYLPPTLRLLLITRVDPALPLLSRRRAVRRLTEIRAADLRFTPIETHVILERLTGTSVSPETTVALQAQTEGWIIGLQMAGISLRNQTDQAAFIRTFEERGHRLAMDFLLDEVLVQQPRPLFDFLLQTSILERFCASLCTAVTGVSDQAGEEEQSYLAQLEQTNLFLVSLDDRRQWYRYHHLFQELLRQRLALEYSRAAIAGLHKRAGAWLAERGYVEEALRHLVAAGDIDAAVSLIEAERHEVLNREDFRTLERWLGMLPEAVVTARPTLLQLKAWVLRLQFKLQAIPPLFRQVESLLAAEPPASAGEQTVLSESRTVSPDILRGERDALLSEIYFFDGDFGRSLEAARSALAWLPANCFFARGIATLYLCIALQATGQLERAVALLNGVLADEQRQHPAFKARVLIAALSVYLAAGELRQVEQTCRFLLESGRSEQRPISIAWGHYGLGLVYFHWNRLEEARMHWSSVPDLRYFVHVRAYHESMLGLAFVQQLQGDLEGAQQTIDLLSHQLLEMKQTHLSPEVEAFRARLALLRGDLAAAGQWAETRIASRYEPSWFWEACDFTRIKVYLAQGTTASLRKAVEQLQTWLKLAESAHQTEQLIEIWSLWALVEAAQNNTEAALAACQRAVQLAEPSGFIRFFVNLGPPMADLLRQLANRGISTAYIGHILAAFPTDQSLSLTEREREILTLLAQGLTDRKIARRLVITVNTVKKHNRNIYQKLGAHSRQRAIAQARALGLI